MLIWHSDPLDRILEQLRTDPAAGLTSAEVDERLRQYGENRLRARKKKTLFQRFLAQMQNPLVIILLVAVGVSVGVSVYHVIDGQKGDWVEPAIILAILLLNAMLGLMQESRAEASLEALQSLSAPAARVLRDGAWQTVSSPQLVPGDIVELEAGAIVPADCRLLEAYSLTADESALTGESLPSEKNAAVEVSDIAPLADRANMLYAGSPIPYGRGRAVVVETGMRTETGAIATLLEGETETDTPLQKRLAKLGKSLGILALAICAFIFVYGLFEKIPPLQMFMTAISLAVAAIPEGLPAVVTIVLAIGVQNMVKRHAIIRRLPAVEALGSASVICSDKTGTLTQNRMTLVAAYLDGGAKNGENGVTPLLGVIPEEILTLTRLATLCTDASVEPDEAGELVHLGDPTETAILAFNHVHDLPKAELCAQYPRLAELPFDSDRKLMTTVHSIGGRTMAIVKGAPDVLLSRCAEGDTAAAQAANDAMGADALRVLAVGCKYLDGVPVSADEAELEQGLRFLGLLGMIDPPRPEATAAVAECHRAGIRTVMITGDHIVTACAIARQLGILTDDAQAISGAQLAAMPDEELNANIRHYTVYARVTPADKIRIVKAWQLAGEVVSMTGDGVNDAPALKAADIGCAMGITGTDVAKGAADMVLTDDNFATIVAAVREGRGIYANIQKAVQFLLSCNFGEILTVFLSLLLWHQSPLLSIHLLFINLVTDGLPALALGMEPVERDVMSHPPRSSKEGIFARGVGVRTVLQGLLIGGLTLLAFFVGRFHLHTLPGSEDAIMQGMTMAFATLALSQLVHALNVRSRHSLFVAGWLKNRFMLFGFTASLAATLAVLVVPPLRELFQLTALPAAGWWIVAGLSLAPLVVLELCKAVEELVARRKR